MVSGLISACVLACTPIAGMSASADIVYGDANGNGSVEIADAVLVMQSLSNPSLYGTQGTDPSRLTADGSDRADVNERGNGITNKDALAIQRKLLDLTELPESFISGTITPGSGSQTTTTLPETTSGTTTVTTAAPQPEITVEANIKLNGGSVTSDSEYAKAQGSTLTITHSGTYNISGKLDNGQICVDIPDENADPGTVKLIFSGVDISGKNAPAVLVKNADKTSITVADGTENTITDGDAAYSGDFLDNAVIEAKDDLTIKGGDAGTGKLIITANIQPAVVCNNDLKFTGGDITIQTLNATDKTDAVKGKTSVTVKGGKLNVDAEGDGIKSSKGSLAIEGGEVTVKCGKDALQAETDLTVSGGKIIACGDRGITCPGTIGISGCELLATATDNQCETLAATDAPALILNFTKEWAKNNPVAIVDGSGQTVFDANTHKKFRYAIVASDKLNADTQYKVFTGGIRVNHAGGDTFKAGFGAGNITYNDVNNTDDAEVLYGKLFDQSMVHSVDVKMSESDWQTFLAHADEEAYYPCDVVIDGEEFDNVAIRTKGNSSRQFVSQAGKDKFSFRIKLNKYDKLQNYHGLTDICLNNMYSDPSCMRDILCYNACYEVGSYAPLCSYTDMKLNGQLYSFYFMAEQPAETLAERLAVTDDSVFYKAADKMLAGSSYDCSFKPSMALENFEVKFGDDEQLQHIAEVKDAINKVSSSNYKFIEDIIDVPSFLQGFAVNAVMCNYDSYNGMMPHNYYLEYTNGKMYYVSWDFNLSLGNFMDNGASVNSDIKTATYQTTVADRPLLKLLEVPEYYDMYVGYVKQIVNMYSQPEQAVDGIATLIRSHVKADPRFFFTGDQFETNIAKSANGLQVSGGNGGWNMWGNTGGDQNGGWNMWGGNNDGGQTDGGGAFTGNPNPNDSWNIWGGDNGGWNMWSTEIGADEGGWGGFGGGGWGGFGGFGGGGTLFSYGGENVSIVDFMIKRNEVIHSALGF